MSKDFETGLINTSNPNIVKGTSFTKKDYEYLVQSSMNLIKESKKLNIEKSVVASLYGVFYSAVAGMIRSGALCSREDGIDGFPELHIMIGEARYHCREFAIQAILGNDAVEIISPYEDLCKSYIAPPSYQNVETTSVRFEEKTEEDKKERKNINTSDEDSLKEIEALKKQIEINEDKHQKVISSLKADMANVELEKADIEKQLDLMQQSDLMTAKYKKELEESKNKEIHLEQDLQQAKLDVSKQKESFDTLNSQFDTTSAELQKAVEQNKKYENDLKDAQAQIDTLTRQAQDTQKLSESRLNDYTQVKAELENCKNDLSSFTQNAEKDKQAALSELEYKYKQEISKLQQDQQNEIMSLKAENQDAIFKLKEEHQKTLAQVQNDNQSLISQLQDENRKQIDRMQAEKNEAVTAATNEIKASYDKLKVESKAEYDKLKADDKNVFDKMAQEKDKKISELQTEIVEKDKELTKSNSKIEGLQSEVTDLRNYQPEEPKEYAYYYNEVIPRLSAGLGFTGESVPAKIALSLVGVVVSVLAGVLIVIS